MSSDPIKTALHLMPYGFYCITSHHGEHVNAMVANWLTQVSFEPRLIALGLQKTSYTHSLVSAGKVFAVNILPKAEVEAIKPVTKSRSKKPEKLAEIQYTAGAATGCPILVEAMAYLECQVAQIVDVGGDHDIIVGEVIAAGIQKEGQVTDALTLIDVGWSYAG